MEYYFSVNLKRYRVERGLSQRQLAKQMNVSQAIVCAWENNLKYPLLDKVYDAARVLEINPYDLLKTPECSFE